MAPNYFSSVICRWRCLGLFVLYGMLWFDFIFLSCTLFYLMSNCLQKQASPVAKMVTNLPAMWETWVLSPGQEDLLEKGMAMNSSILAWRIPWTKEPGGLQSMGLQRVRHDWVTNAIYVCKNTDTSQFFIRQLREFLLTMPCETLMKVNMKYPSKGLSVIPYNFINLNQSKDQIFQFISAIY